MDHYRSAPLTVREKIVRINSTLLGLAFTSVVSCGGGDSETQPTPNRVPISLPSLAAIKSDMGERPNYGTAMDPMQYGSCLLFPVVGWQQEVCANPPIGMVWPEANYYSTAQPGIPYWTLAANNEPAFEVGPCTTGVPNRSRAINGKTFLLRHDQQSITLKIENTPDDNCQKIPYLAINNFDSRTLTGNYGDQLHVAFTLTTNASNNAKHYHFFHFFVYLTDAHGNKKYAWLDLYAPPESSESSINWNWPVAYSVYEPGAAIRALTVPLHNAISDMAIPTITLAATQDYDLDLDRIVKAVFPADAVATTKLLGIEISVEHDFKWDEAPPLGTIFTEMTLSNMRAYRIQK